jgi:hypothetical protein
MQPTSKNSTKPADEVRQSFFDHLRQTHFVLLTICGVNLIILFAPDALAPAKAELTKIDPIITSWSSNFLHSFITNTLRSELDLEFTNCVINRNLAATAPPPESLWPFLDLLQPESAPYLCEIILPAQSLLGTMNHGGLTMANFISFPKPDTLRGFKDTWDRFIKPVTIIYPESLSSNVLIFQSSRAPSEHPELIQVANRITPIKALEAQQSLRSSVLLTPYLGSFEPLDDWTITEIKDNQNPTLPEVPFGLRIGDFGTRTFQRLAKPEEQFALKFDLENPAGYQMRLSIIHSSRSIETNITPSPKRDPAWWAKFDTRRFAIVPCVGKTNLLRVLDILPGASNIISRSRFDVSFPQLSSLMEEFGDTQWDALSKQLDAAIRGRETKSIDLAGLSIPQPLIGIAGPVLIALAQLYFFLHLAAIIHHSLHQDESLFPCVLVYKSRPASLFTYFTCSLLPIPVAVWVSFLASLELWFNVTIFLVSSYLAIRSSILLGTLRNELLFGLWLQRCITNIISKIKQLPRR